MESRVTSKDTDALCLGDKGLDLGCASLRKTNDRHNSEVQIFVQSVIHSDNSNKINYNRRRVLFLMPNL